MKNLSTAAVLATAVLFAACTSTNRTLERRLAEYLDTLPVRAGVFVRTDDGMEAGYNADEEFPMLSTFKFPVALAVMAKMERDDADPSRPATVSARQLLPDTYSPMRERYGQRDLTTTLGRLLAYCVSQSDNNACDILINYAGGIDSVARYVVRTGVAPMRITATEQTMHTATERQRDNTSSPRAMVELLSLFREGRLLSQPYRDTLMRYMTETSTGRDKLRAGIPESAVSAHKTGSSDRTAEGIKIADNDVGIISLPDGRVCCIAVFVCDSPMSDAENAAVVANVARMVCEEWK